MSDTTRNNGQPDPFRLVVGIGIAVFGVATLSSTPWVILQILAGLFCAYKSFDPPKPKLPVPPSEQKESAYDK